MIGGQWTGGVTWHTLYIIQAVPGALELFSKVTLVEKKIMDMLRIVRIASPPSSPIQLHFT